MHHWQISTTPWWKQFKDKSYYIHSVTMMWWSSMFCYAICFLKKLNIMLESKKGVSSIKKRERLPKSPLWNGTSFLWEPCVEQSCQAGSLSGSIAQMRHLAAHFHSVQIDRLNISSIVIWNYLCSSSTLWISPRDGIFIHVKNIWAVFLSGGNR